MKTAYELRAQARTTLRGHWGRAIVLCLIPLACMMIINNIIGKVTGFSALSPNDIMNIAQGVIPNGYFADQLLTILVSMFFTIIFTGVLFKFIDWDKDPELEFSAPQSVLNILNYDTWMVVKIYLWEFLFTTLWTMLFIIPGIVKMFSYSQAFNLYKIAAENGEADKYRAIDYITQSRQVMNGNKGRLFYLGLTFIGWIILSILSLCIGFIWIIPYINAAKAAFFNDLMENK